MNKKYSIGEIITRLNKAIETNDYSPKELRPLITSLKNYYVHSNLPSEEESIEQIPFDEEDFQRRFSILKIWAEENQIKKNTPNVYKSRANKALRIFKELNERDLLHHTNQAICDPNEATSILIRSLISDKSLAFLRDALQGQDATGRICVIPFETSGNGVAALVASKNSILEDLRLERNFIDRILGVSGKQK